MWLQIQKSLSPPLKIFIKQIPQKQEASHLQQGNKLRPCRCDSDQSVTMWCSDTWWHQDTMWGGGCLLRSMLGRMWPSCFTLSICVSSEDIGRGGSVVWRKQRWGIHGRFSQLRVVLIDGAVSFSRPSCRPCKGPTLGLLPIRPWFWSWQQVSQSDFTLCHFHVV